MNDRQQRGFVVLLQEAHVQSGRAAERGNLVAEVVAADAAGKRTGDAKPAMTRATFHGAPPARASQ